MAEKVKVEISVDGGEFKTGLLKIKTSALNFKADLINKFAGLSIASLVIGGVQSAISFLGDLAEEMGRIKDKAEQFSVSMREWQVIINGVKFNGGNEQSTAAFFDAMSKSRQEALSGNEKYANSFKALGISLEDLKSKSNGELFYAIADGVAAATDRHKAYYDAMVLGKGGAKELFNALSQGGDALRAQGEEMGVYSNTMINIIDAGAKKWEWLWSHIKTWCAWGFAFVSNIVEAIFHAFNLCFWGIYNSLEAIANPIMTILKALAGTLYGISEIAHAVFMALTGNFSGAIDTMAGGVDKVKNAWKNAGNEMARDWNRTCANMDKDVNNFAERENKTGQRIYNLFGYDGFGNPDKKNETQSSGGFGGPDYAKIEELQAKLDAEREKYAFEQLDSLGKIKNLEGKIADLKKDANETTEKGLNASIKMVELEKQLAAEKQKVADKEKKELADLETRKQQLADAERQNDFEQLGSLERILTLEAQIAEEKRKANRETKEGLEHSMKVIELEKKLANENQKLERQREQANKAEQDYLFSKMSKEEQIKVLQARAVELRAQANDVTEDGLKAKVEFYANQKQLDSLTEKKDRKTPEAIASSLAAIGGGGNVYSPAYTVAEKQLDESKKQSKTLEKIADNTEAALSAKNGENEIIMR